MDVPYSSTCLHAHTIHDHITATLICEDCALVLQENTNLTTHSKIVLPNVKQRNDKLSSRVEDICENFHIPQSYASDITTVSRDVKLATSHFNGDAEVIAYGIYSTCKMNCMYRTLEEVEMMTGCSRKKLWSLEKRFGVSNNPDYSALLERYCYFLGVTYSSMKMVQHEAEKYFATTTARPHTIIAACISMYTNIPINEIVTVIPVNKASVYKFKKEYKKI